jgi:hypothetical protein
MAIGSRTPPLGLTRDQLASFLKDHEQIKQFENLFAITSSIAPDVVNEVKIDAGTAQATAIQAIGQISSIAQELAIGCSINDIKVTQALDQIAALAQEVATSVASIESKANQAQIQFALLGQEVASSVASIESKANQAQIQSELLGQEIAVSISSTEYKANQALALLARLAEAVEGLQMLPRAREFKRTRYGSFYDTTTQSAAIINTATAITFNTTDISNGVYRGTPTSRIYVDTEGIYNFQISVQLDSTVSTAETFYIWFRINGVDVTYSASQVRIQGNNAEVFVALNLFFNLKSGDYIEIMFSVSDLGVQLLSSGAVSPYPGIPSIILTVSNIQGVQ